MRMRTTISIALFAMIVLLASSAFAGPECGGRGTRIPITEDQMELLRSTKTEMIESGASPEEIHTAMMELLTSFGIEMPEACGSTKGGDRAGCHGTEGHSGCDGTSCSHAPGECDRSCDKPADRAGCHGAEGRRVSGGCCSGTLSDKNATTAVGDDNQNVPTAVTIGEIIPNPFNPSVEIRIHGKFETTHTLDIFDVRGRLVNTLPITGNSVNWDGKDSQGRELNTGTYFARVTGTSESRKIVLMK